MGQDARKSDCYIRAVWSASLLYAFDKLASRKFSKFWLVSIAEQTILSLTWLAIPKTVFSDNGPTYSLKLLNMGLLFSDFVGTFTST